MNEQVRISPIRLIDHEGTQRGIVSTDEARSLARDLGMDLVEISPTERPPVCRIMDYGKYKYDQKKRQKQRTSHVAIKMGRAVRFLKEGSKVQFTMLFRGRERAHQNVGLMVFQSILDELGEEAKVERPPRTEGRRMTMVVAPVKQTKPSKPPKPPKPSEPSKPSAETESQAASATETAAEPVLAPPAIESRDTRAVS